MSANKKLVPREVYPLVFLVTGATLIGSAVALLTFKKGRESSTQPWAYMEKDPAKVSEMRRRMVAEERLERAADKAKDTV